MTDIQSKPKAPPGGAAIVLAAGEGKRMKSPLAKVLHPVCGMAMIDRVLGTLREAGFGRLILVTGHQEAQVRAHVGEGVEFVTQAEQLGTGHAVMQARRALAGFEGPVLVTCGDTPLWRPETLRAAAEGIERDGLAGSIVTMQLADPAGYGRVLRDEAGGVRRVVEHKDATEEEKPVREVNSGTYCFHSPLLFEALDRVGNRNAQGEYYLPDVIEILLAMGHRLGATIVDDPDEALGVNSPSDLAAAEEIMRRRISEGESGAR